MPAVGFAAAGQKARIFQRATRKAYTIVEIVYATRL